MSVRRHRHRLSSRYPAPPHSRRSSSLTTPRPALPQLQIQQMAHEMAQRMMWQHIEEQQALYRQSQSARGKKGKKGGQKHKRQHGQAPAELWRREHHSESERRAQAEQWLAQQKLSDTYLQPVREH